MNDVKKERYKRQEYKPEPVGLAKCKQYSENVEEINPEETKAYFEQLYRNFKE